jgi:hypothetical protein
VTAAQRDGNELVRWLYKQIEELKAVNAMATEDFAVQRPDGEILGIYSTRPEAESHRRQVSGRAHVVKRVSSPWSKPLT